MDLTTWVKHEARALGFHLVGVTSAEPFPEAESRALTWLEEQRNGEMAWLSRERMRVASRPRELLPGARSVIALGVSYRQPENSKATVDAPAWGRVARYAVGLDYHDVLRTRMRELLDRLERFLGQRPRSRIFVDSSPLLEREVAARAGLGFFGKNSLLLAAGGSYYLLGAIVTELDLEPDAAVQKDCGQCRLCIDACPTQALYNGHSVDARRCISYLTIELRGPLPIELRPRMGSWTFGCDICQEVCPYNRGQGPVAWPELQAQPGARLASDPAVLLGLDQEAFSTTFRGSPIKRTKRRGLLRNATVALGNSGNADAVEPLIGALGDHEPLVRGHAAWGLGRLGGARAESALRAALAEEVDEYVRGEIRSALSAGR
jgi:epoxyqueuosine reductase